MDIKKCHIFNNNLLNIKSENDNHKHENVKISTLKGP